MPIDKYFYPIPKSDLISRFLPVFDKINKSQSATLLALPYTGRTSHLRFITSQPQLLHLFNINPQKQQLIFFDIDKTFGTFDSFIFELSSLFSAINPDTPITQNIPDIFLNTSYIYSQTKIITKSKQLILIITLNSNCLSYTADIDKFLVQIQKSATNFPVSILWSIDTRVYRNYQTSHPSTSIFDHIFFYPTFSAKETRHSITRISKAKLNSISKSTLANVYDITGGIAGLFHPFINKSSDFYLDKTVSKILTDLKSEYSLDPNIFSKLSKPACLNIVNNFQNSSYPVSFLTLKKPPSGQEINLVNLFTENFEKPISRDSVATAIWGSASSPKYSDIAIDKAISRLRKNIVSTEYKIITLKNYGYQLIKFL